MWVPIAPRSRHNARPDVLVHFSCLPLLTSEPWSEAVVVSVQKAVQDPGEHCGVVLLFVCHAILSRANKHKHSKVVKILRGATLNQTPTAQNSYTVA